MFDLYWHTMLIWNYPRRGTPQLAGRDRSWRRDRQRDLYWGWFRPDYIRYDGLSLPSVSEAIRRSRTQGANDKARRAERHLVLLRILKPYFRGDLA